MSRVLILDGECRNDRFSDEDHRAFDNPKWKEKLESILDKCPVDLNIVIERGHMDLSTDMITYNPANKPIPPVYKRIGSDPIYEKVSKEYSTDIEVPFQVTTHTIRRNRVISGITNYENRVNVILSCNGGQNKLPMTPWITLHRACHAIQLIAPTDTSGKTSVRSKEFQFIGNVMDCLLDAYLRLRKPERTKLMTKFLGSGNFADLAKFDLRNGVDLSMMQSELAQLIGNTKTLRTGHKLNCDSVFAADFQAELWTEYFFRGKITINVDAAKEKFKDFEGTDDYNNFIHDLSDLSELMKQRLLSLTDSFKGKFLYF